MIANIALSLVFGVLITLHISMNARAGTLAGSAALVNAAFWIVGAVSSVVLALPQIAAGSLAAPFAALSRVPPLLLLSGVIGGGVALFNTWMIPRIGIAAFSLLIILGQLSASAVLARTGFLGALIEPLGASRIAGLALVAVGTALFLFGR